LTCPYTVYIIGSGMKVTEMRKYGSLFGLILVILLALSLSTGCASLQDKNPAASNSSGDPIAQYRTGADPVTGRNGQVDLAWEQLCLATGYELQIAKDKDFTLKINPAVNSAGTIKAVTGSIILDMDSTNVTNPAAWLAPGTLPEAGAIYWWRIRVYKSATGQLAWSPWSDARSFIVKPGFIINTPYYGVMLLSPINGCVGCKVKPASFSWSPYQDATKYQIDVSKDPEFKQMLVTATTSTTA
jgi:hypothetical protein